MSSKITKLFRYVTRLFGRKRSAGCVFLCKNRLKIGLVQHRIDDDGQEHSFGVIGGPVFVDESMVEAVLRHVEMGTGYVKKPGDYLVKLDVYANLKIRHITFLYVIEQDFYSLMADDYTAMVWLDLGEWPYKDWPRPLDRYVISMLYNPRSISKILAEFRKEIDKAFENSRE